MDVVFANAEVGDALRGASARKRIWADKAHAIGRRLADLAAMGTLADAAMLPGLALTGLGDDGRWCLTCLHGVEFHVRAWPSDEAQSDPNQVTGVVIDAVKTRKEVIPA